MATARSDLTETLAGIALFADVGAAELQSIAHIVEERRYAEGERIIRQGISGSAFYIILEGEATIRVSGKDYGTLGRGEFFGEISALLGEPPVAAGCSAILNAISAAVGDEVFVRAPVTLDHIVTALEMGRPTQARLTANV